MDEGKFEDAANFPTSEEIFTLRKAIDAGHRKIVTKLLQRHPKLANAAECSNYHNSSKTNTTSSLTPLGHAISKNRIEIVNSLLSAGADPEALRISKSSIASNQRAAPLHLACARNQLRIVLLLLEFGANRHCKDHKGQTPIQISDELGHREISELLGNWSSPWDEIHEKESRPEYRPPTSSPQIAAQLRTLRQKEKTFGANHPGIISTLHRLGMEYEKLGQLDNDIQMRSRILAIVAKTFDPAGSEMCSAVNNLGEVHFRKGNFKEACARFKKAVQLNGSLRDTTSGRTPLENLAICQYKAEDFNEAELNLQLAIRLAVEHWKDECHPSIAQLLLFLANCQWELGNPGVAKQTAAKALAIVDMHFGPVEEQVALSLDHLGRLYYGSCEYAQAEVIFRRSLEIRECIVRKGKCKPNLQYTEDTPLDDHTEELLMRSRNNLAMSIAARRSTRKTVKRRGKSEKK